MAQPNKPVQIGDNSQQAIIQIVKSAVTHSNLSTFISSRQMRFQDIDRYYQRENLKTKEVLEAERKAKAGDKTKLREMIIGVVKSHTDSVNSYLQETFLSGYPIFPVVSEPGEADEAAIQLETIMSEHCYEYGWEAEFMKCFADSTKYNESFLELEWKVQKIAAITASNEVSQSNGNKVTETEWQGNVLKRIDPYNVFYDPRVPVSKLSCEGEYIGYKEIWTKIKLKTFILEKQEAKLPIMNPQKAITSQPNGDTGRYFIPEIILEEGKQREDFTNWALFGGFVTSMKEVLTPNGESVYSNQYEVSTVYMRLIPSEVGIKTAAANTPQIWKFVIVNDQHLIWAEQQSNAHGYLPIFTCQPLDPGSAYQTKSFSENAMPYQDTASALWNLGLAAQRRGIVDRMIYDPSKIDVQQMNNPNSAAKIPLRPSAYGTPPQNAVYQIPFNINQNNSLFGEASSVVQFADDMNGQNRAQRGQFQKGNKSRFEYADVMSNSNNNNRAIALQWENQTMVPLKRALLLNVLQYSPVQTMFNRDLQTQVTVNPIEIRRAALQFKVADGVRPADKILDGESWQAAMTAISTNPQLAQEYKVGDMFASLMSQRGVNLRPFRYSKEELQFQQAMGAWQQAAQMAAEKGTEFNAPQPKPSDYGVQQTQQQAPAEQAAPPAQGAY